MNSDASQEGAAAAGSAGLRIFLNYRREDARGDAGRLYDDLVERYGKERVFRDVDTLEPGEDFDVAIDKAVRSCDVLIAMVGQRWLAVTDAKGRRRIDDPDDFVRLELKAALAGDVHVVPIRVEGAAMPGSDELPEELARFAKKHALELSDSRWSYDRDRLISTLERIGQRAAAKAEAELRAAADRLAAERADAERVAAARPAAEPRPAAPAAPPVATERAVDAPPPTTSQQQPPTPRPRPSRGRTGGVPPLILALILGAAAVVVVIYIVVLAGKH